MKEQSGCLPAPPPALPTALRWRLDAVLDRPVGVCLHPDPGLEASRAPMAVRRTPPDDNGPDPSNPASTDLPHRPPPRRSPASEQHSVCL
ncbi:unnamed protein product [Boreogadus saida]